MRKFLQERCDAHHPSYTINPRLAIFPIACGAVMLQQEIVPIMDLAVNEEFTRMYSEEELLGAQRIQVRPCCFAHPSSSVIPETVP